MGGSRNGAGLVGDGSMRPTLVREQRTGHENWIRGEGDDGMRRRSGGVVIEQTADSGWREEASGFLRHSLVHKNVWKPILSLHSP